MPSTVLQLIIRYTTLFLVALAHFLLGNASFFYLIFTPLTVYPSFLFFNYAFNGFLVSPTVIFFKGYYAQIIPACVAGSAYFLLFVLIMATPMSYQTRTKSFIFLGGSFLIVNIVRIIIFGSLLFQGYQFFDIAHLAFWYFGSTLMVVGLWFANVFLLKIEAIPFLTDMQSLRHND